MNSRLRKVLIIVGAISTLLMIVYLNLYTGNATNDAVVVPGVKLITADRSTTPTLVLDQGALIACANNKSGVVRLLSKGKCDPNSEKTIAWSIAGATGATGNSGTSAGKIYYLDPTTTSDISGYRVATSAPADTPEFSVSYPLPGPTDGLVASFITPKNDLIGSLLPPGVARRNFCFS